MVQRMPDRVDPWRLIELGETLEGRIALKSLPRLAPLLVNVTGNAAFVLVFRKDASPRSLIDCHIQAELTLVCQRCLQPMSHPVDVKGHLALVQGMLEAGQLPKTLDPLMLAEDELLDVQRLVEDELLLAIPVSPRHETSECAVRTKTFQEAPAAQETPEENPFAILAGLKAGKTDS